MRVPLALILTALALAGCAARADKQLLAVKSARSAMAEWALVEEQADTGRAPPVYVEQMRQLAHDQLDAAGSELRREPEAARVLARIRTGSPDPAALQEARSSLQSFEKRLESS